ncbi:MAG: GNAT family N-acetyltransferase [Sphingomicrobium sp.]
MAASPAPSLYHIHRGGVGDLDDVMRIMESAFSRDYGEGWSRSQCGGIMPMWGVSLMIARDHAGRICGFSLQRVVMDESELLLLAVDPSMQRRGVGGLLLGNFIDEGRDLGLRILHLEVRDGNPAIAMYRTAGFEQIGKRAKYYRGSDGVRYDAITMAIDLG